MKSTGIVRKTDELGRIVLPKEIRRTHNIQENDFLEIFIDGDDIILRKYMPGCKVCGSLDDLTTEGDLSLCRKCIRVFAAKAR